MPQGSGGSSQSMGRVVKKLQCSTGKESNEGMDASGLASEQAYASLLHRKYQFKSHGRGLSGAMVKQEAIEIEIQKRL